jgi:hypothetical protein
MGFADSHRPKKYDVCFLGDELQAKEVLDLETIYLFGMIPLKLFEGQIVHRADEELTPGLAAFELLLDIIGLHRWLLDFLSELDW